MANLKFETSNTIKTTKPFVTKGGNTIHLVHISDNSAIICIKDGDRAIQVNGPIGKLITTEKAEAIFGGLIDWISDAIKTVIKGMGTATDGSSTGCSQTIKGGIGTINIGGTGNINNINITITCAGQQ